MEVEVSFRYTSHLLHTGSFSQTLSPSLWPHLPKTSTLNPVISFQPLAFHLCHRRIKGNMAPAANISEIARGSTPTLKSILAPKCLVLAHLHYDSCHKDANKEFHLNYSNSPYQTTKRGAGCNKNGYLSRFSRKENRGCWEPS